MREKPPFDLNDFRPPAFPYRLLPYILGGLAVLILIISSVHRIEAQEVGVVQRFGRFDRILNPGLNFVLPFYVETVTRVPVQVQLREEFGIRQTEVSRSARFSRADLQDEAFMITGDLNAAEIRWVVQYRISDPYKFLFRVRNAVSTFRVMNEAIMRELVGDRTINEVITYGRRELVEAVEAKLQEVCDQYEIGIQVERVSLQNVSPPEPVVPAFNEVNEAQQDREKTINQAQAEYNKIIPRARGEAQRQIEEARGDALERVNRARGDAARFNALYAAYRKAPEVTRQRIYLETMSKVMQRVGRKIITEESASGILPLFDFNQKGEQK